MRTEVNWGLLLAVLAALAAWFVAWWFLGWWSLLVFGAGALVLGIIALRD